MAQPPNRNRRIAVSDAEHHRRRRRIALAGVVGVLAILVLVVAGSAGSSATWDPAGLQEGAIAALPKLKLNAQAERASQALARQKEERAIQANAIDAAHRDNDFIRKAGSQHRELALSFDDGPSIYTQRILDTLQRQKVKATFFVIGRQLAEFPFPLQRAVADGHAIGNHTWAHPMLATLPRAGQRQQLQDTARALQAVGIPRPKLMRPPYGSFDDTTISLTRAMNVLPVMWTVDSDDYESTDPKALTQSVIASASPGAIILMHDGGGNRTVTAKALPGIIRGLKKAGYKLVTVPQLLVDNPPQAEDQTAVGPSEGA